MLECFLFFRQPFFFLGFVHCAAKFFTFLAIWSSFVVPPVCSCLHLRLSEKPIWSVWAAKREWKRFHHFLVSLHPLSFHPLFRLWPTFHSSHFIASAFPLSPSLSSSHSSSPLSIPSALYVTSSGNYERKPGPMAAPFSASSTGQPQLSGGMDALRPSFWRRATATTTASFPQGRVGWFWHSTTNVPHCRDGWCSQGKRDCYVARFVGEWGKGDNHCLVAGHGCLPCYGCSQGKRDRNATHFAGEWGKGDNHCLVAGGHCSHGCLLSSIDRQRYSDGPANCALLCYGPGDPVGHPLGWVLASPSIYEWIPMPQPGTAAPVPLVATAVLPAAASLCGRGSGTSSQDAPLARVCSSASLFWVTPGSFHGVPAPRRGCTLGTGPLSQQVFTATGPSAARVISGTAGPYSAQAWSRARVRQWLIPGVGMGWSLWAGFGWPTSRPAALVLCCLTGAAGRICPICVGWRVGGGGEASQSQAPCLTAAELALGAVAQPSTFPLSLHESAMVATAVHRIQEEARAYNPEAAPESVPNFPGAFPPGKFVRLGKPVFTKGLPLSHLAIPSATLRLSQDDMLLIPERFHLSKVPHPASIPKPLLVNWEEMARRGLETTSVMGSLLGSLVGTLRDPESDSFQLHHNLHAPAILALIQTLAQGLKASADIFARLHFKPILARRDSTMSASSVVLTSGLRTSLRTLPKAGGCQQRHGLPCSRSPPYFCRSSPASYAPSFWRLCSLRVSPAKGLEREQPQGQGPWA